MLYLIMEKHSELFKVWNQGIKKMLNNTEYYARSFQLQDCQQNAYEKTKLIQQYFIMPCPELQKMFSFKIFFIWGMASYF